MKASVQYNDRIGHAAADIANINYNQIAELCNLGERFTIIGISLYGTDEISVSLICRDNVESTNENEVLVDVFPAVELSVGDVMERLNVTINITNNLIYDDPNLETDREHTIEEDE
ncbi:hypothetical protein KXJ69_04800 [Aureisphaera sp. CAU 1614]|uniref:Uncharacterized protein n=1 Tax=Halomarinibacterium sedimenti TaxID=2857106 RepID=A0A9X1JZL1_9FLAO|nr:hypothetical protein [Halomarinibacterium sedimenti]MBW2937411.1 hypothetical protein [Halomarinibacterium sedimenti]